MLIAVPCTGLTRSYQLADLYLALALRLLASSGSSAANPRSGSCCNREGVDVPAFRPIKGLAYGGTSVPSICVELPGMDQPGRPFAWTPMRSRASITRTSPSTILFWRYSRRRLISRLNISIVLLESRLFCCALTKRSRLYISTSPRLY